MRKLIILGGDQNVGKTTTLRKLAEDLLLMGGNYSSISANNIHAFFSSQVKNNKLLDLWLVIPTSTGYVYIATKGDDNSITTANVAFFNQDYQSFHSMRPLAKIYTFDINGNAVVLNNLSAYKPDICYSGSRITVSVMKPLLDYAENHSLLGAGLILNMRSILKTPQRYNHFAQVLYNLK